MAWQPGDTIRFVVATQNGSGAATDVDGGGNPAVTTYRNGAADPAVVPTFTHPSAGLYLAAVVIPATYANGDVLNFVQTATVGGQTGNAPLCDPIKLDTTLAIYAGFEFNGKVTAVTSATSFTVLLDKPLVSAAGLAGRFLYWVSGTIHDSGYSGLPIKTPAMVGSPPSSTVTLTFAPGWGGITPSVNDKCGIL